MSNNSTISFYNIEVVVIVDAPLKITIRFATSGHSHTSFRFLMKSPTPKVGRVKSISVAFMVLVAEKVVGICYCLLLLWHLLQWFYV